MSAGINYREHRGTSGVDRVRSSRGESRNSVDMTLNRNSCVGRIRSDRDEFRPSDVDRASIGKGNTRGSSVDHVRSGRGEFRIKINLELTL